MKIEQETLEPSRRDDFADPFDQLRRRPVSLGSNVQASVDSSVLPSEGRSAEAGPETAASHFLHTTVIGELIGIADGGRSPLVSYPRQVGTAALRACSIVDLHGEHIGRRVVLTFESGDPSKPIVIGVLRDHDDAPLPEQFGQVEVDADAGRLIITAKERLVLRCGTASITLTSSGKVLIEGSYVLSRSSGSNRVKGGSVQLN